MKLYTTDPGFSMRHVLKAFDWGALPKGSLCVDLGGGEGEAAITVARKHPNVRWEVQDLPNAFANLAPLPEEVKDRVKFIEHDFFTPQTPPISTSTGTVPSIFFLRWILHNHSDKYAHTILQASIPSLTANPSAKIVVMESILPPVGFLPNTVDRYLRAMDVTMLELGNGQERDEEGWRKLFRAADPDDRFVVERVGMIEGSKLGCVVVGWKG